MEENNNNPEPIKHDFVEQPININNSGIENNSKIEIPKKKKSKIPLIVISIIVLAILSASGWYIWQYYDVLVNGKNNSTKNNDKKAIVDEGITPKGTAKKLMIYKDVYGNITADLTVSEQKDHTKIGQYNCSRNDCRLEDATKEKQVLIYDDNAYYLYNYVTNKAINILIKVDKYDDMRLQEYNKFLYGVLLEKDGQSSFYNIKEKKVTVTTKIDNNSSSYMCENGIELLKGYIIIYYFEKTDGPEPSTTAVELVNIKTGIVALSINKANSSLVTINNGNYVYYYTDQAVNSEITYQGKIYNEKLVQIIDNVERTLVGISKDGKLLVASKDGKTFNKYNNNGSLISTSKTYSSIKLIDKNYIAVVDTDGYLKLIDDSGKVLTTFVKWPDTVTVDPYYSGYKDAYYATSPFDTDTEKAAGVYITLRKPSNNDFGDTYLYDEYFYNTKTGETKTYLNVQFGGMKKPLLYLYPTKDTKVNVSFENPNVLTTTYPKYNNNWSVLAKPNGDLYDSNNKYYYGLYWEESGATKVDYSTGFYVTKDNAITFLEDKLAIIGLNAKEANEFIMYWLPILEKNKQSLVYFELTNERQAYNKLIITPTPDSLLRVGMHVRKVNTFVNIKPQKLTTFKRTGFTAVEWGGVRD